MGRDPLFVINLEVTRAEGWVTVVLVPATRPRRSRLVILDAEYILLSPWPPFDLDGGFGDWLRLLKQLLSGNCCDEAHWAHWAWRRLYVGDRWLTTESICEPFVDLIPMEMRLPRNWWIVHCHLGDSPELAVTGSFDPVVQLEGLLDEFGLMVVVFPVFGRTTPLATLLG